MTVTIYWCDKSYGFSSTGRHIYFKGQDVTSQFTYTYQGFGVYSCATYYSGTPVYSAVSQGTVYLTGPQTVDTLTASMYDLNGTLLSGTQTWQMAHSEVAVTPHGGIASPTANQTGRTQAFQVRNNGNATTTYTVSLTCSGNISGCSAPSSVTVTPGAAYQQTVSVSYTSGAPDTKGTIQLAATAGAYSDVGTVYVTNTAVSQPTTKVLATEINPGVSIDRASCLVFAIVRDVASECGALRITHALPSVRTLNRTRTPTLIYYSDQLDTTSLGVQVILADTATIPDSVQLNLWDVTNGTQVALAPNRTYGGVAWSSNRKQRLTASRIASGATRIVKYQVEVKLKYGSQWSPSIYANGELAIVNRATSRFGAGWWLAGVERLFPNQWDGSVLWIAGDGSTRKYVRGGAVGTDTAYLAEAVRRPDTLFHSAQGVFRRSLSNGTRVYFNSQGLDSATVNLLGHSTRFYWTSAGGDTRLDSLSVPSGTSPRAYTFHYDAAGQLDTITAPAAAGTTGRKVALTRNPSGTGVTRISGPDAYAVNFEFQSAAPDRRYLARTDRRGTRTQFSSEPGSPGTLYTAVTPLAPGDSVRDSLWTVTGIGASPTAGPVAVDSAYLKFRGPRVDSVEITRIWVDRFGAPSRVINPIGDTTIIRRDDWRFPGQVTRVEWPVLHDLPNNGVRQRVRTATFNAAGNIRSAAELRPYFPADSTDAVTRYEYDNATWPNFVTRIVPAERDSTVITYNTDGTMLAKQDARGNSTQMTFAYESNWKLPAAVYQSGIRLDSVTYSSDLGDQAQDRTAANYVTSILQDGVGRDTLVTSPRDSLQTVRDTTLTSYDVMDRIVSVIRAGDSTADGSHRFPHQRISVYSYYDPEGNPTKLVRSCAWEASCPSLITRWAYDALNRRTREYVPDNTVADTTDNPFDEWRYDHAGNVDTVVTRGVLAGHPDMLLMSYDRLHRLTTRIVPAIKYGARTGVIQADSASGYVLDSTTYKTTPYPMFPNDPTNNPNGYTISGDTAHFTYDKLGNALHADNRDALVRRRYYLNGLLSDDTLKIRTLAELSTGGDTTSHVYAISHSYDLDGRPLAVGHPTALAPSPSQNTTTYTYDPAGELSSITDALGFSYLYAHSSLGQVTAFTQGSRPNFAETYKYDAEGNLSADTVVDYSPATYYRATLYRYLPDGKLALGRNSAPATKDTTWVQYSGLGQLVDGSMIEQGFPINNATAETRSFYGNALGNPDSVFTGTYWQNVVGGSTTTTNSVEYRGYESGTGRLAFADKPGGGLRKQYRDTTEYDPSGNDTFERTIFLQTHTVDLTRDRASFYGADGKLRALDGRSYSYTSGLFSSSFEEYRYDALGRRVLVYTRRHCYGTPVTVPLCNLDWIRRTVWDGTTELYEIQMPIDSTVRENDTAPIAPLAAQHNQTYWLDPNPFYGRVAYTNGVNLDRPQSIIRIGYVSKMDSAETTETADTAAFAPFAIVPLWDLRGEQAIGLDAQLGFADHTGRCETKNSVKHCVNLAWPGSYLAYDRQPFTPAYWHGTIHEDKKDASGLFYRRNRYYDGSTGRFTQEDPLGIAGGINEYGFAAGDPITFSDPFGLLKCDRQHQQECTAGDVLRNFVAGVAAPWRGDLTDRGPGWRTGAFVGEALIALGVRSSVGAGAGAGDAALSAADVLMPGGSPIGSAGARAGIREVSGGMDEASQMFEQLARGGTRDLETTYPGTLVRLPNGGTVGMRTVMSRSRGTAATLDVNIEGIPIQKIKFNPEQ